MLQSQRPVSSGNAAKRPATRHQTHAVKSALVAHSNARLPTTTSHDLEGLRQIRDSCVLQCEFMEAEVYAQLVVTLSQGTQEDVMSLARILVAQQQWQRCLNLLDNCKFVSAESRYLGAKSLVELDKWDEALECIEGQNDENGAVNVSVSDDPRTLSRLEALKAKIHLKLGQNNRAINSLEKSVAHNPVNIVAFEDMIDSHLLAMDQENQVVCGIDFEASFGKSSPIIEFIMKTKTQELQAHSHKTLAELLERANELEISSNLIVLRNLGSFALNRLDFEKAYQFTSKALKLDNSYLPVITRHTESLYELKKNTELFELGHRLVKQFPKEAISWYVVAVYYLATKKFTEARKYFSHATTLNERFVEGWIGFGHSFALDGEHDQAISAYATASRLFPGNYLPLMFLGMQYSQSGQFKVASEILSRATAMCTHDPVLLNELGTVLIKMHEYKRALTQLVSALKQAQSFSFSPKTIAAIHLNLGHAYRHLGCYQQSIEHYNKSLEFEPSSVTGRVSLGLVFQTTGDLSQAIEMYHTALSLEPDDTVANELLDRAIKEHMEHGEIWKEVRAQAQIEEPEPIATVDALLRRVKVIPSASKQEHPNISTRHNRLHVQSSNVEESTPASSRSRRIVTRRMAADPDMEID